MLQEMAEPSLENVADLIASPPEEYVPEPRYVSKYRDQLRKAAKRGKSAHKTLGVPSVSLNPPTQFLKKNSSNKLAKRPEVHHKHYHRPGYQHKLPDWQPIRANDEERRVSIDFAKRNINEAKNMRPLVARKYYVDDRHGTARPLKNSGLIPLYRDKKQDYEEDSAGSDAPAPDDHEGSATKDKAKGQNVKENARNEQSQSTQHGKSNNRTKRAKSKTRGAKFERKSAGENIKKSSENSHKEKHGESRESSVPGQPRCRYVTEDERSELLYGMKKKWDEMMLEFQCLPFMTDTPPKTKRKAQMEKDLLKLEKDIQVIERHPYIYVYSDSDDEGQEKEGKTENK